MITIVVVACFHFPPFTDTDEPLSLESGVYTHCTSEAKESHHCAFFVCVYLCNRTQFFYEDRAIRNTYTNSYFPLPPQPKISFHRDDS